MDSEDNSDGLMDEELVDFHRKRMLFKDRHNLYELIGIIDYDESKTSYVSHVLKHGDATSWWYTFANESTERPHGGINRIMEELKAPHMLFYKRV